MKLQWRQGQLQVICYLLFVQARHLIVFVPESLFALVSQENQQEEEEQEEEADNDEKVEVEENGETSEEEGEENDEENYEEDDEKNDEVRRLAWLNVTGHLKEKLLYNVQ